MKLWIILDKFEDETAGVQLVALLTRISGNYSRLGMLLTGFAEAFTPDVAILTAEDLSMLIMYLGILLE